MAKTEVSVEITGKDRASPALKGVGASLKGLQQHSRMAGMAMVAFGAAVVGSMALIVKSTAAAGDAVAKMAIRTGFTTESLSKLRYAAELSGTSLEGIEKATRNLSKVIVQAGDGLTTYIRAFDRVGLSYEKLLELSPEEQFLTTLEAVAGLENVTERLTAAQELFGSRMGTQLLPLLENGTEGLRDMMQGAEDLGLVFSQDAANAARDFQDSLTTLKASFNGITRMVGEAVMPIIQNFAGLVTDIVGKIKDWADKNEELADFLVILTGTLGLLAIPIGTLLIFLPQLAASYTLVTTAVTALNISLGVLVGLLALATAGLTLIGYGTYELIKSKQAQAKAIRDEIEMQEELAKWRAGEVNQYMELYQARYESLKQRVEENEASEAEVEWYKKNKDAAEAFISSATAGQDKLTEGIEDTTDALIKQKETIEELSSSVKETIYDAYMAYAKMLGTTAATAFHMEQMEALGEKLGIKSHATKAAEWAATQPNNYDVGGIVPGPIGQAVPAIVHGGETILSPGSNGVPLNNTIKLNVILDGELISTVVSTHQGRAYLTKSRFGG